ncbi:hypothetical protein [Kibdelosporangium phytohabitans]|uniref:Uncharacterized protein n=1 Tax=Kibdelosporangium phytohabitans TaxID=860235 RepID=A0A0N9I9I2_9PSEU|nr:hypothetical protein [Kibdelosporangium phytohabitans]ALG13035.1 hypothetical protein AOZ06_44785 [Kibdelosporangium phytohabitans]MBE1464764.1 hypothetical protein [Kibdelosporangium phytohabitans]
MPRYAQESSSRFGSRTGPFGRGVLHFLAVFVWLAFPAILVFVPAPDEDRTVFVIVNVVVMIIMIPLGLPIWRTASQVGADQRRLDRVGLPAVAEVLASDDTDLDGMVALRLRLRLSGDGFDPFEATVRCGYEDGLTAGARFNAKVDPSDQLFMIVR